MIDLKSMLIPYPQKVSEPHGMKVIGSLGGGIRLTYDAAGGEVFQYAIEVLTEKLLSAAGITIEESDELYAVDIKVDSACAAFEKVKKKEAYSVEISDQKTEICGYDEAGVYYAVLTLCNLFCLDDGKLSLPMITITDWPDFADRTQFVECRYGSDFMKKEQWFDMLDYFSGMKFNGVTVGLYGCWPVQYDGDLQEYLYIPFQKYPELRTPKSIKYYSVKKRQYIIRQNVLPEMFQEDFFGELIAYGKKRNVKVIPLFNSLGHNTVIPREFPQLSAKDEDGKDIGFGFCTESSETYEFMCDLYDEIIERYLQPNDIDAIAIGLDEVLDSMGIDKTDKKKKFSYLCKCEKCCQLEEKELMIRYIIRLCKYLKSKGMKSIYIYQDMLFYRYNIINEELRQRFIEEDIYDVVVIDWWSYDVGDALFKGRAQDVNGIFRSTVKPMTGYFHWSFPTEVNQNIKECVELARKLHFEGVRSYTGFDYCYDKNFLYQADVSWNTDMLACEDFEERYACRLCPQNSTAAYTALVYLKDIMSNDRKDNYMHSLFSHYMHSYLRADLPYPRSYPGEVYSAVLHKEDQYIPYLEKVYTNAKTAYDILKSQCEQSRLCDIWQLSAMQYYVTAGEFLTMIGLSESYEKGLCDEFHILNELERLIHAREELMAVGEDVKISGNAFHYLREMTIIRQYFIDLKTYVKDKIKKGERPELDIKDLNYIKSDLYDFLR